MRVQKAVVVDRAWWRKTATANRTSPPDQATQDRPGPPATQDHALPAQ